MEKVENGFGEASWNDHLAGKPIRPKKGSHGYDMP
jgi:hypothetical protein